MNRIFQGVNAAVSRFLPKKQRSMIESVKILSAQAVQATIVTPDRERFFVRVARQATYIQQQNIYRRPQYE